MDNNEKNIEFNDDYEFELDINNDFVTSDMDYEDLNIIEIYFREITKYPLLTREDEIVLGRKLKLRDKIEILTTLRDVKDSFIIDLEKIFVSITDLDVKNYVFGKIKSYYCNVNKTESTAGKIVVKYLNEYENLCKTLGGNVPSISQLSNYFEDIDGQFVNFDVSKKISFDTLASQIDMFLSYMIARDTMINCNLRLVVKCAKSQVTPRMSYLDCIEEGNLGLIRAVLDFDIDRGCKFSTYAYDWILQYIQRGKENKEFPVRVSSHMHTLKKRIERMERVYYTNNGRFPTDLEIADDLGLDVKKVEEVKRVFYFSNNSSLDVKIGDNEDDCIGDFIADSSSSSDINDWIQQVSEDKLISELMAGLNKRELEVLKYRFGFYENRTFTLEEIGKMFGVTRERIRQVEAQALRKLKIRARGKEL